MKRIGRCAITRPEGVDTLAFPWGRVRMLSEPGVTGAESFSFGYVELEPAMGHSRHRHPDADEVIYVLSGEGQQMLDDQEPVFVRAGDCIWVPKGVYHATVNRSAEVMRLLVVYAPAGAEAALRADPAARVVPAEGA
jgi:oxalate decarboxylase/phosphoglucose isomerase-like protein (cupin superfamily)